MSVLDEIAQGKLEVAECDECKKLFPIKGLIVNSSEVKELGLLIHYFVCPYCEHIYVVLYDNAKTQRLQKQYEREKKQYNKMLKKGATQEKLDTKFNSMESKRRQCKKERDLLKQRFNGLFYFKDNEV